jgi:hypothetical protein
MNLLNFSEHYPDEASCIAKFKEYRERQGVVCAHVVEALHIIGKQADCNLNASNVIHVRGYEVAQ